MNLTFFYKSVKLHNSKILCWEFKNLRNSSNTFSYMHTLFNTFVDPFGVIINIYLYQLLCLQTEFVSSVFHFTNTFNALNLNDAELGLFSAIVLLSGDRPGVTDLKAVEHHQDRLIDALKVQV